MCTHYINVFSGHHLYIRHSLTQHHMLHCYGLTTYASSVMSVASYNGHTE